ncbi:MAG: radical SAM family heme chaperone HemW [Acutalibacteraceae bacterium]|jgi:oxygen-independent coproporphyrinogen-3 oxidase
MTEPIGLYIHVPFCVRKCPYCDFYSLPGADDDRLDGYVAALLREMERMHARYPAQADTLYFGGGTPSLLGGKRIAALIDRAAALWGLHNAEITLEANPGDELGDLLAAFKAAGGNRLSLGMQAVTDEELAALGRRHTRADTVRAVEAAHRAGIDNLSLDVMLGIPRQTDTTAVAAVKEAASLGATHLSAYLLKIEEGTPFAARRLDLPNEDEIADRYLAAAQAAGDAGFAQYEISNFARPGFESRHNLKYWDQRPYLGLGPSAHSFMEDKRWYYPRDLASFLQGVDPLPEAADPLVADGSKEEYLMLRLRLTAGITEVGFQARFGSPIPALWRKRAAALPADLTVVDEGGIRLTRQGFLVSNHVIAHLLDG